MEKIKSRPARIATQSVAGREKTTEHLKEDLRKTREELAVQKWGLEKTLKGMKVLVKELIQKKKEVEEAKAKNEALLESIGEGVVAVDKDGKIILINHMAEHLLGLSAKQVMGKLLIEAWKVVDEKGNLVPEAEHPMAVALKSKTTTTTTTTYYYVRRDGTKFPVAVTATQVILNNQIIAAINIFRDITKEQEIDKAKTEFVSLASHQLRTPLSTVKWYTGMLLSGDVGKLNKEQKKYLDEVYKGNKRMVDLVNALLNVSRLELGTFVVEPEPTDVVKFAQSVIDEQKPQVEAKKLKLSQKYADKLPKLNADPKLLRMVFQNLLSNSVKYTPKGGKIEISLSLSDANGQVPSTNYKLPTTNLSHLLIKVSDTGYGIPENQQDKIFSKLFRADNVREKDTEGTGLGLYIVKAIIDHSGGKISFESPSSAKATAGKEVNKGTTFYVTLPLEGMKKKEGAKALT